MPVNRNPKYPRSIIEWLRRLASSPLLELVGFGAGGWIYFFNARHLSYPLGIGGFFGLMAEMVAANPFHPPLHIPFYGGGGTIFAYPPLGIYMMALWLRLSGYNPALPLVPHSPLLLYFRFAPAFYCLAFLLATYFLARVLFEDRLKAVICVVLVSTLGIVYSYHDTAAGIVRAPAYAFCMAGLAFFLLAVKGEKSLISYRYRTMIILAGLCFGLTILTHLSYVVFFIFTMAIFSLSFGLRKSAGPALGTALVGLAVASPWIFLVGKNFGWQTFMIVFNTHGANGLLPAALANPLGFPKLVLNNLLSLKGDWTPAPLFGVAMVGTGYSLVKRGWLLPVWFGWVFISMGEAERYLTVILCFAIADLLGDLPGMAAVLPQNRSLLSRFTSGFASPVTILFILWYFWFSGMNNVRITFPLLSHQVIDAAQWVQDNTPPDAQYLFAPTGSDLSEWLPFLTRRSALVCPWGGEWNKTYYIESKKFGEVSDCVKKKSYQCLNDWLVTRNLNPDLLIVPTDAKAIVDQINAQPDWRQRFANDALVVFERP